jgi:hypothetical protein
MKLQWQSDRLLRIAAEKLNKAVCLVAAGFFFYSE